MAKKKFLSVRTQIAIAGVGLWALLAAWTLSAFWDHIGALKLDTQFGAKCGAMAGEFALLCLVLWHCYSKHLGVRKWSLILGFILSAFLLVHAGALYGMKEAEQKADEAAGKVAKALTDMSVQQSEQIGKTATRHNAVTAAKQQGEVGRNAQKIVAESVVDLAGAAKESSILPLWYLNGWMYSALFILSLLMVCVVVGLMQNNEDIDEDFDGKPDAPQSVGQFGQSPQSSVVQPQMVASDGEGREWVMTGDNRWEQSRGSAPYQSPSLPEDMTGWEPRSLNGGRGVHMVRPRSDRAQFVTRPVDAPSDAPSDAVTRPVDAPSGGGIEKVRDALRGLARPGHFYFKAEERREGVWIRQCVGNRGKEEYLNSAMLNRNLLSYAQGVSREQLTADLKRSLQRRGFDLNATVK